MNNKINKNLKYVAFAILLLSFSCSEDFLDVEATAETEEALTAEKSVELVNAVYNRFLQWQMSSFSWNGLTSITTDDADKGSSTGDTGTDKDILDAIAFDPTTISIGEVWSEHYNANQRITQAITRIPEFDIDEKLKTRLIGEAKFLRALIYFRLVKTFGGVPLISDKSDFSSPDILKRASKEDTYLFIENDLQDAINSLPEKNEYAAADLGRATKGAAKALLAKVSMYQNKWQEVLTLTNEVITSKQYDLTTNYEDIWKEIGENNTESIFEIQAKGGDAPTAGVQGYSVTQGARGDGGWGWGFNTPTEDLANSYEPNDARRDATIIFRGETLFDGRLVPNTVTNAMYNQKAYSSANSDAWETGKNIRILRFAEVLLMNAEAALEVGGDAATPLNRVRKRAGLDDATVVDKMTVWKERRHELAFEHDRYFDLVRQGRAGVILRAHGKNFIDGKHEVFPIPQEQIDKSGGILTQNPMY
ncbi:RagB/SusD family nutrient uptake outer membrane protein [Polaribacter haliotis]|uniref:RagB/SusD family nutrient uptake outer membrane protein n=2 Tax=Polaribacter TaxID=52959 RepID=A0A7L8AG58_9FLAO|nr:MULTISPECIES: RagB/SusD family nutrient uptake outer membrane protein [Polaribacter]MDD7914127.1 RagB/SusD family nutrient uptake outer membrane protein [Polaribacter sp. MSW5]QOD60998.1 RagB/SusD family nutrient uptake outer membrane protein [Polaribacter haliotis]